MAVKTTRARPKRKNKAGTHILSTIGDDEADEDCEISRKQKDLKS